MLKCFFFLLFMASCLYAKENTTTVEADSARYDGHELVLKGHVIVENPMGKLSAEEAVLKRDEKGTSDIDFPWLHLSREVALFFSDGGALKCQEVYVDYQLSIATFEGPPQIYYKDEMGELFADWAQVDYVNKDGKFQPQKVSLRGNVQMVGSPKAHQDPGKPSVQYALADSVDYFPEEERMVLTSGEGRSVLFYDHSKEMQLSARTVHASRSPVDGKESVQGIGDVRFIFKQEEFEKLKQRFKWD